MKVLLGRGGEDHLSRVVGADEVGRREGELLFEGVHGREGKRELRGVGGRAVDLQGRDGLVWAVLSRENKRRLLGLVVDRGFLECDNGLDRFVGREGSCSGSERGRAEYRLVFTREELLSGSRNRQTSLRGLADDILRGSHSNSVRGFIVNFLFLDVDKRVSVDWGGG